MKQVTIRVTGKNSGLRDTTIGKEYIATRYEAGEVLPHSTFEVDAESAPAYIFVDDVGDMVHTLENISGALIEEV